MEKSIIKNFIFGNWLNTIILVLASYCFFSTPLLIFRQITSWSNEVNIYFSFIVAFLIVASLRVCRNYYSFFINTLLKVNNLKFIHIVFIGFFLRIFWVLIFNAVPESDGKIYLSLAENLINGKGFEIASSKAYWPVGFPLYLSAWLMICNSNISYIVSNLFLYFISILGINKLGNILTNHSFGNISSFIFAIWPNLIFYVATPEKEVLIIAILTWTTLCIIKSFDSSTSNYILTVIAGFLIGFAILVQPSLQFFPIITSIFCIVIRGLNKKNIISVFLFVLSSITVIAPWTIRNYSKFNTFVLVSTNGGSNLYRANNPLATGGYTDIGEINLDSLTEIEQDIQGRRLAVDWILNNPYKFLILAFEKQFRFMGDDSGGAYGTLKIGKASNNSNLYFLFKALSNLWWVIIWSLIAFLALNAGNKKLKFNEHGYILIWIWLYFFILHSVFESNGKYHVPILWVLCILIAWYSKPYQDESKIELQSNSVKGSKTEILKQVYRFVLIGGFATSIQYVILVLLVQIGKIDAIIASNIGFLISAGFNYILNYHFTFSSKSLHRNAITKFSLVAIFGLVINSIVMSIIHSLFHLHYLFAQICATGLTLIWNFTVNRVWTFGVDQDGSLKLL